MGKQGLSEKPHPPQCRKDPLPPSEGKATGWLGSRQVAVQTIALYQRYLSPLKGFHCAHRRLHGGTSCSEYVKQTIATQGIRRSLPLCRERFQACRVAHETLKARQQKQYQTQHPIQYEIQNPIQQRMQNNLEDVPPEEFEGAETAETEIVEALEQELPAETITQGDYYAEPDLAPPLPPPNPLASCLVCGVIDGCCGGPSTLGGMGCSCGDPLEGCSCCWDGCNLSAFSCCF